MEEKADRPKAKGWCGLSSPSHITQESKNSKVKLAFQAIVNVDLSSRKTACILFSSALAGFTTCKYVDLRHTSLLCVLELAPHSLWAGLGRNNKSIRQLTASEEGWSNTYRK